MFEQSRRFDETPARGTFPHSTLYFFDIVEDYPEIGGVASVSRRLRSALQHRLGARVVAVRDIADRVGCGDTAEDYLVRERRAILRLAQIDPASTLLVPNFQNPVGRTGGLARPNIINIVHDVQFAYLPDLFTLEQQRWLDGAFAETRVNADAIAFVSRTTRDHYVARYGEPRHCRVIAAPIGTATPNRAAAGRPPFLLAVQHGECHPHKNLGGLLRLFAELAERSPALKLLVTGRGSASFDAECEALPRHVRARIEHLGHVSRGELTALYRGAEAFVSLSRFEGFNMPAAEAACCGTPLILSDLPVHRELHAGNACFLDPCAPDATTAAAFLSDGGPGLRGYTWNHAEICAGYAVAEAHIGLIAALETPAAATWLPTEGRRISATTLVFRVGIGRNRPKPTARPPIAAAVSRQRLARALLAGTILGGSAALMLGGSVMPVRAQTSASCSTDGSNASGGNGGPPSSSTAAAGNGGCTTNQSVNGGAGQFSGSAYYGGGGGAGGNGITGPGTGGGSGNTAGGLPGVNGVSSAQPGGSAATISNGGGGGGGGYYGGTLTGSTGGFTGETGGQGGSADLGLSGQGGGGGGGGGGAGTLVQAGGLTLPGASLGGAGGSGGSAYYGAGGDGGNGGAGTVVNAPANITFSIDTGASSTGGDGGTGGGSANYNGGNGGNGGAGVVFLSGGTLNNAGTIQGGTGGSSGGGPGAAGAGGAGLVGAGLAIVDTGTISGGYPGDGSSQADALHFTGGLNTLTLQTPGASGTLYGNIFVGLDSSQTGSLNLVVPATTSSGPTYPSLDLLNMIYGAGSIEKSGGGVLILDAQNSYTGGTILTAGTVQVVNSSSIGTGKLTFNGGTLQAGSSGLTFANAVTINSPGGTIDAAGNFIELSGRIDGNGPGPLTIQDSGTGGVVVLSGSNYYSGGTILTGGTLQVTNSTGSVTGPNDSSSIGTGTLTFNGGILQAGSYGLTFANAVKINSRGGTLNSPGGTIDAAGNLITLSGNITDAAPVPGTPGSLAVVDTAERGSIVVFSGNNTYSGATLVGAVSQPVTLQAGSTDAFSPNSAFRVDYNAVLALNGFSNTVSSLADGADGSGTVENGLSTKPAGIAPPTIFTIAPQSGITTFSGQITDGGNNPLAVVKTGAGTQIFAGTNYYSGGTAINAGTLGIGTDGAFGSGDVTFNGGTLQGEPIDGTPPNITLANNIAVNSGGGTVDSNSGALTLNGNITGPGGLTYTATGGVFTGSALDSTSIILTGTNSYSGGSVVRYGTSIEVRAENALGSGSLQVDSGAVIDLFGYSQSVTSLNGAGKIFAGGSLTAAANTTTTVTLAVQSGNFSGVIENGNHFISGGTIVNYGDITLLKTSSGTLTLSGDNAYGGGTLLQGGTIAVGNANALGTGTLAMSDGTTLQLATDGPRLYNNFALTGNDTIDTVNYPGGLGLSGVISGTGTLVKIGSTGLGLNTPNTYSGGTLLESGYITLRDSKGLGTGTLTMFDGTGLHAVFGLEVANAAVLNGTDTIQTSNTAGEGLIYDGVISGTGTLVKTGSSGLRLTAANTYSGGTVLSAGHVGIANDASLGTGLVTFAGGFIRAHADGFTVGNAAVLSSDGTIDTQGFGLTYAGAISGAGQLIKAGIGTLLLTGNDTYAGGTNVAAGTLQIGNGGTAGAITGNLLDNGALVFDRSDAITFPGAISGPGSLTQAGTGTLILTGNDTYTGGTTIAAGTLQIGNGGTAGAITGNLLDNGALVFDRSDAVTFASGISGAGSLTQAGTGTLTLTGANTYTGGTTIATGTLQVGNGGTTGSITGDVLDNGALAFARSDAITFAGGISGAGSLTQAGTGTLTLTGANAYTGGTTIAAGTLQIGNGGTTGSITGDVLDNGALAFARSDAITFAGGISGSGSLSQTGTGTLVLTGNDTYAGGTTIAAGTLQIGNGGTTGSVTGDVVDNGTLVFDRSDAVVFAGAITGPGELIQAGAGTLDLTGTSSYTGPTDVQAGRLAVDGTLGNTSVTVRSGATLGGTGIIAGPVTIADRGILAPGDSPGTLTAGSLTLTAGSNGSPGSILNYELGTIPGPSGQASDLTEVVGNLTLAGTLNVSDAGGFTSGSYRLFDYGGTLTNNGLGIGMLPGTFTGVIQTIVPNQVNLIAAAAGVSVQFWDGPLTTANGTVNGGTGTWNNSLTNWTDPNGTQNAPWGRGQAIFAGTAGTVTVADTIAFEGLQFSTDGYVVDANGTGTLNPTGQATILVDSGLTATIAAPITGPGGITKSNAGTLVLTGADTYTGGTTIQVGTLQIGNGGAAGSIVGDVANNGALVFDRSDAVSYGGVVSGTGSLTQAGPGTLTLTGQSTYTGTTTIAAGTLALSGQGSIAGSNQLVDNGVFDVSASSNGVSLVSLDGIGGLVLGSNSLTLTNASGTFGGTIGGAGQLILEGGTEVLSGSNTYSGGTTITGGTLQIGNDASLGTGALVLAGGTLQAGAAGLTVANAAQLTGTGTIDTQSFALAYAGVISGSGQLDKTGTGKLILTQANSYSGGTLLQQGTLALGNAGALGTGALAMDQNTTLVFATGLTLANDISFTGATDPTINTAGHDSTISGTISGPGALTKKGAGTLTLTADNTYTGPTTVAAGTLAVDGGIAGSTATIDSGATLSGSGTVGGLLARAGATVSPGTAANPYGTLHVVGAASFASGATFAVSINAAGQSSRLAVGGSATLGGAGVTVASASGTYDAATRYTVLTAGGGVKGLFGSVSTATALAFLNPYLSYGSNSVTLAFRSNGNSFATVAVTPNQQSVAAAIQGLDPNSPVVRSLQGLSPDQARRALDALAGAAHASAVTATVQDAGRVRTLLFDRLWNIGGGELDARTLLQQMNAPNTSPTFVNCFAPLPARPATPPTVYTAWGEGFGSFGHDSGDQNGAGLDHSLGGFVLGIDAPIHGLGAPYRVGIAGGYAQDRFTATGSGAGGTTGTSETIFGALYGGTRYGAVDVRLGVSAAHDSTDLNRNVSYPGFNEGERSNYGGHTEQAFGELGYRIAGPRYVFEPTFGAAYIHVHQDSFREQGGAAALLGFAQDNDLGTTTLGARGEIAPITGVPLVARAFLGWRHTFGDINPISRLAFVAAPIPFTSQGAPIDTDVLAAEAGLDYRYSAAVSFGVSYVGQVGPRDYDHGVKGRVEYKF